MSTSEENGIDESDVELATSASGSELPLARAPWRSAMNDDEEEEEAQGPSQATGHHYEGKDDEQDQNIGESPGGRLSSFAQSAIKLEKNRPRRRRSSAEKPKRGRLDPQQHARITSTTQSASLKQRLLIRKTLRKERTSDPNSDSNADDLQLVPHHVEPSACESRENRMLNEQKPELWMEIASIRNKIAQEDSQDPLSAVVVSSRADLCSAEDHLDFPAVAPSQLGCVQPESPLVSSLSSANPRVSLVVARAVDQPESESTSENDVPATAVTNVVVATPVRSKVRSNVAYALCAIVVIAVTVGVSVGVAGRSAAPSSAAPPPAAAASPSLVPTLSPASRDFQLSLPPYTQDALEDPESPQSQAFRWVASTLEDDLNVTTGSQLRLLNQIFSLASFFYATGGESAWGNSDNWLNSSANACEWYGCNCTGGGDVQSLILDNNQVGGTLPREIGLLTALQKLDLRFNGVGGSIPSEIGLLTGLTSLELQENLLYGSVPSEIGDLTLLEAINLQGNLEMTGKLPTQLGQLVNLRSMLLDSNRFTGVIPSELGLLEYLKFLRLANNQFNGTIPSQLGRLGRLEECFMQSCGITGTLPTEMGDMRRLAWLELYGNADLLGTLPSQLGRLLNLQYVILDSCSLSGTIPTELGRLTNLVEANFSFNSLAGTVPTELCNLVSSGTSLAVDCESVTCDCGCECS
jgi:hypothetical protein